MSAAFSSVAISETMDFETNKANDFESNANKDDEDSKDNNDISDYDRLTRRCSSRLQRRDTPQQNIIDAAVEKYGEIAEFEQYREPEITKDTIEENSIVNGDEQETFDESSDENDLLADQHPYSLCKVRDCVSCFRTVLRLKQKRGSRGSLSTGAQVALSIAVDACDVALAAFQKKEISDQQVARIKNAFVEASGALLRYCDTRLACDINLLAVDVLRARNLHFDAAETLVECANMVSSYLLSVPNTRFRLHTADQDPHYQALHRSLLIEASRLYERVYRLEKALTIEQSLAGLARFQIQLECRRQNEDRAKKDEHQQCGQETQRAKQAQRAQRALKTHTDNIERLQAQILRERLWRADRSNCYRYRPSKPSRSWAEMNEEDDEEEGEEEKSIWLQVCGGTGCDETEN